MELEFRYVAPKSQCVYLPDRDWQMEYAYAATLSAEEYLQLLNQRWRRFGHILFRPRCPSCNACQPIRVLTHHYQPNRSQRRVIKANADSVRLVVDAPQINDDKINLYMRHHRDHAQRIGWPEPSSLGAYDHLSSIVNGPFAVEEWCYYLDDTLIAVSYMDALKDGFSGIYYFYDPSLSGRSLGTWIIITMIRRAASLGLPYAYLGYFIEGCRSMEYKGCFRPSEFLGADGKWHEFTGIKDKPASQ